MKVGQFTLLIFTVSSLTTVVLAGLTTETWTDYLKDRILTVLDSTQRYKRDVKQPPNAVINFEDCGEEDDLFYVDYVTVFPNPVKFPGVMNISYALQVKEDVFSPIKVEMTMSKKISLLFGLSSWFDIPCLEQRIGSCNFDDLCDNEIVKDGLCRQSVEGGEVACGCPFLKGNYTSKPVSYKVPAFPEDVPAYLLRGEFVIKAVLSKDDQQLACYQADFFLEV